MKHVKGLQKKMRLYDTKLRILSFIIRDLEKSYTSMLYKIAYGKVPPLITHRRELFIQVLKKKYPKMITKIA